MTLLHFILSSRVLTIFIGLLFEFITLQQFISKEGNAHDISLFPGVVATDGDGDLDTKNNEKKKPERSRRVRNTIGLPKTPNPLLNTIKLTTALRPLDPECRLREPTDCCGDLWHLHWWVYYIDLKDSWPWYLEQERLTPGRWISVPQTLPIMTFEQFRAPMKAINININRVSSSGRWADTISFNCVIALDDRDVLFDLARLKDKAMALRIT